VKHYQRIIKVLAETDRIMGTIIIAFEEPEDVEGEEALVS
jgi:hypothetical protein